MKCTECWEAVVENYTAFAGFKRKKGVSTKIWQGMDWRGIGYKRCQIALPCNKASFASLSLANMYWFSIRVYAPTFLSYYFVPQWHSGYRNIVQETCTFYVGGIILRKIHMREQLRRKIRRVHEITYIWKLTEYLSFSSVIRSFKNLCLSNYLVKKY